MIRLYSGIPVDGSHRLVGTPSEFSTAFSINLSYTINDAGKFLQPNASSVVTPFFADFKAVNVIESVVTFSDAPADYTFFRVTGYQFEGINNIRFFVVVEPFLTYSPTVNGLICQSSRQDEIDSVLSRDIVLPLSVKPKRVDPILSSLTPASANKYRLLICLSFPTGIGIMESQETTYSTAFSWALAVMMRNHLKDITSAEEKTYKVLHVYLLPSEFAFDVYYNPESIVPYPLGKWQVVSSGGGIIDAAEYVPVSEQFKSVEKTINITSAQFAVEVGTPSTRIALPDYRASGNLAYTIKFVLSCEQALVCRMFAGGYSTEIQRDFELDLIYSEQSQYNAFQRQSDELRQAGRIATGAVSTVSSALAGNAMGVVSGIVKVGDDIAGIYANELQREKQVAVSTEQAGNLTENINTTGGVGVYYYEQSDLVNYNTIERERFIFGKIFENVINVQNYNFSYEIAGVKSIFFVKFLVINNITGYNIPAPYYDDIKNLLLQGIYVKRY